MAVGNAPQTDFPVMDYSVERGWFVINNGTGGDTVFYNLGTGTGSGNDAVTYDFNLEGNEGYTIPLSDGQVWYPEIGWALDGFEGNDTLQGYDEPDWLRGGSGNDILRGMDENDSLEGGTGNDSLYGGDDDDTLAGGENDDWLNGDAGADTLYGGLGNDGYRIREDDLDKVIENAGEGTDSVYFLGHSYAIGANVENLFLDTDQTYGASLSGNELANTVNGALGNDWIYGNLGADTLNGGNGADRLYGGGDADRLYGGAGADKLYGEAGDDYLDGGAGADTLEGGAGNDSYVLDGSADVITEGVNGGVDTVESLMATTTLAANVENLKVLFAGAVVATGNELNNVITGGLWSDSIEGGAGHDTLMGSFGNDTVKGGLGNDWVKGETGNDWVYGEDGNDTVDGGDGVDFVYGGAGADSVLGGNGSDFLYGGLDADVIRGGNDADSLYGDAGNDTIWGDAGNDMVQGGDGNDVLHGGDGVDRIHGNAGSDLMYGEGGADVFVFTAPSDAAVSGLDRIMDFVQGSDRIDLSAIDADAGLAGNQAFHFYAARPIFTSAGDLWAESTLMGTLVKGDLNGDGAEDFRFLVTGVFGLTSADFAL